MLPIEASPMGWAPRGAARLARALARAALLSLVAVLLCAGCGDDGEESGPEPLQARMLGTRLVARSRDTGSDAIANPHLSPGRTFSVAAYEVPQLLCVRTDSMDYLHIPEATSTPGLPAVFLAVPPATPDSPILMLFHGNGLDFIEALASLFAHAAPRTAEQILRDQPGFVGFIEILNRNGAWRGVEGEFSGPVAAEALERGWGIVAPGNCWGDGGYHRGEVVDYYMRAPRYGRVMDDFVWDWYRRTFRHDARREYSFGCSGGGQRTAQLLLQRPGAVVAAGIDSPADYLLGFRDDPPSLFSLLQGIPQYRTVLDDFYLRHYGSFEQAAEQSLGTQLAARGISTPIYFTYSARDPLVTPAVSGPLARALAARFPEDRQVVLDTQEPVHCQINNRQRAAAVLDWLAQWQRGE